MGLRVESPVRRAALALLIGLACAGRATAGNVLNLSGNPSPGFNTENINFAVTGNPNPALNGVYNVNGGNIVTSTLNGQNLPYLYCVQYHIDVYVPGTYNNTDVDVLGNIDGAPLKNAGGVAYLMTHYAAQATTQDLQAGLQAAIWYEVTGGGAGGFVLGDSTKNSAGLVAAFQADLAGLGIGNIATSDGTGNTVALNNLIFLTPTDDSGRQYQGLVGLAAPEPSTVVMAGSGGLVLAGYLRRRRRAKLG
jgi:hypothetical protein